MKKLLFPLIFIVHAATNSGASCMNEPHSLTELLLHDEYNRSVFRCRIQESGFLLEGGCFATGYVDEVYKGDQDLNNVVLYTGGHTSAGGQLMDHQSEWLIFGRSYENGDFGAAVCDPFSCEKSNSPQRFYNTLQILASYHNMVKTAYSGRVIWQLEEGRVAAEGFFRHGKPHGKWRHYHPDGNLKSIVRYKDGLRHGKMIETSENGWMKVRTTYKNGLAVFQHTTFPKGGVAQPHQMKILREKNGFRLVYHQFWHPNGKICMVYKRWEPIGKTVYWANKPFFDGAFLHQDSTGKILNQGEYMLGAKIGSWIETSEKSSLSGSHNYAKPEKPNFDFFDFFENGQLRTHGNFKDGQTDGIWWYFSKNGILIQETHFVSGQREGEERHFYADKGNEWQRIQFKNGKKHGEELIFLEDGALRSRSFFQNGLREGEFTTYLKHNQEEIQANYLKDKWHGKYIRRNILGDTMLVATLEHGVLEGDAIEYCRDVKKCHKRIGKYHKGIKDGAWTIFDCSGKFLKKRVFTRNEFQRAYQWSDGLD